GVITVPSLWPITLILLGSTSGCSVRIFKAFSASCIRSLAVAFPHTFVSRIAFRQYSPGILNSSSSMTKGYLKYSPYFKIGFGSSGF
ncbi:MAG TPA: hypothetical protein VEL70_02240, partial [Candidatus Acidoferrum sp.]|nr:hypothetical protein [Candidatus Acidoferrum sp.]